MMTFYQPPVPFYYPFFPTPFPIPPPTPAPLVPSNVPLYPSDIMDFGGETLQHPDDLILLYVLSKNDLKKGLIPVPIGAF